MRRALVVALFVALPLHADTLGDLKNALTALRGQAPLRATVALQRTTKNSEKKTTITGNAAVEVSRDTEGLHVNYPTSLLARVESEQNTASEDPDAQRPTVGTLGAFSVSSVAASIDAQGFLQRLLAQSKLLSETRVTYQGRPARLLQFKVTMRVPKTPVGKVDVPENALSLWIGDDNLPLAGEHRRRIVGGVLFLKGEATSTDRWTFSLHGDHLVAVRTETQEKASGLGRHGESREVMTVTVK